jgi:hypothetical protein
MASTRNKNTLGNYNLEQRDYQMSARRNMVPTKQHEDTRFAGNGLNPGQVPANKLSTNAPDVESYLFGIGSTNLTGSPFIATPELNLLSSAHLFEKTVVYMPRPLIVDEKQRPQFR